MGLFDPRLWLLHALFGRCCFVTSITVCIEKHAEMWYKTKSRFPPRKPPIQAQVVAASWLVAMATSAVAITCVVWSVVFFNFTFCHFCPNHSLVIITQLRLHERCENDPEGKNGGRFFSSLNYSSLAFYLVKSRWIIVFIWSNTRCTQ